MSIQLIEKCPVCGQCTAQMRYDSAFAWTSVNCKTCGRFNITNNAHSAFNMDKLASYLYYKAEEDKTKNTPRAYTVCIREDTKPTDNAIIPRMVEDWYPKSFSEKIDYLLLLIDRKSACIGDGVQFDDSQLKSACFVVRNLDKGSYGAGCTEEDQYNYIISYLRGQQYITDSSNWLRMVLAPKGWQRVEELQRNNPNNRDVFIAMSFDPKNNDTKEAIKTGIITAGYNPVIMSELIHNKQIVPMMFRLIKESQLLVMDVSDPNYGAYYEAGYALGLGKEVIISCNEEVKNRSFEENEKEYEKYLKPHFDIAQKQILYWTNYADLSLQLSEWIKAIAG